MPRYEVTRFDPPAPLAGVNLRNPETGGLLANVSMLIDTGADVTLIPKNAVFQLGLFLETNEQYELMGFDGNLSVASVVRVEMGFLGKTFRGRFLLIEREWGVIGRDVLNHLVLLFDGPKLTWEDYRKTIPLRSSH